MAIDYQYPHAVLLIFCKTPLLGQVKTRLMSELNAEEALAAHLELSRRILRLATKNRLCPVELWCAPTLEHPFFAEAARTYGVRLCEQQGRDLGERMHYALIRALCRYRCAVLIGSDCPSLTEDDLEAAINALDKAADAVFSPAEDGGYVLVGLNRPQPELFAAMPWGTSAVMEVTRARLAALGERHVELKPQWDVDTAEDFARYRKLINASED
ncbi:TIGR04282 family arsenosugar biosynthesis glycosyltransferase [Methylomicrobium lacus]|uniref:TIGR04282 family arsenosugar biosynthesis glycosyltransferase n=1 Tax=Methylomicrobium lacus TaxID=136992 RepID=UPI0035A96007